MKYFLKKYSHLICLLFVVCGYTSWVGFEILHANGIVDCTKKNKIDPGCLCHVNFPADTVRVWIIGPDSVRAGSNNIYTVFISGGPAIAGGFNVATDSGTLSPFDTTAQVERGELTHVAPKLFQKDTVMWKFYYQAPSIATVDTLYSAGNSTNHNGAPTGDAWNFGENVPIHVLPDTSTGVVEHESPKGFILYQNFPNPFNPKTLIGFQTSNVGFVTLKIFDIQGKEVSSLVSEIMLPGYHQVWWDASGIASGVFFYRLTTGVYSETRKILLIR